MYVKVMDWFHHADKTDHKHIILKLDLRKSNEENNYLSINQI